MPYRQRRLRPGPLYNDITLPADAAAEVRALILTLPSAGTFAMAEGQQLHLRRRPGRHLYRYLPGLQDGVAIGGVSTITLTVGAAGLANAPPTRPAQRRLTAAIRLAGDALAQAWPAADSAPRSRSPGRHRPGPGHRHPHRPDQTRRGRPRPGRRQRHPDRRHQRPLRRRLAQAAAGGWLTTGIRLTGASLAVATATGDLGVVTLPLAGSAVSLAAAGSILTAQIRLAGAAVAQATAGGSWPAPCCSPGTAATPSAPPAASPSRESAMPDRFENAYPGKTVLAFQYGDELEAGEP